MQAKADSIRSSRKKRSGCWKYLFGIIVVIAIAMWGIGALIGDSDGDEGSLCEISFEEENLVSDFQMSDIDWLIDFALNCELLDQEYIKVLSNGFHDDISMAAVVIGTDVMAVASRALNARLGRDDIFGDFCAWRSEYEQELQRRRDETDGLMAQRKEMLEKINLAKENGKQRGELQQALDELNRQIDELQKKKEAMERQLGAMAGQGLSVEEMSQSKSRLDDEWKQKKAELDEYEYGSKRSNSKYYRKYREMMPKLAADEHQQ